MFRRYFRLYGKFWAIELQKQLIYQPLMAAFSYLAHSAWVVLSYVFLLVVIEGSGSQTQLELLLFLSYFHSVKGLFWICCSWSSAFLAGSAFREGKIDFLLTKPLPSQWFISSFRPNIFALTDLLLGIASFVYFSYRLGLLTVINLSLFLISMILSALILYAVWFSYLTFFVPSGDASASHGLMSLLWIFGEYPNKIYDGVNKVITTIIFPTIVITTLPMSIIMGQKGVFWLIIMGIIAYLSLFISSKLWARMLNFYTSAS